MPVADIREDSGEPETDPEGQAEEAREEDAQGEDAQEEDDVPEDDETGPTDSRENKDS